MPGSFKATPRRSIRLHDASSFATRTSSLRHHVTTDDFFSGRPAAPPGTVSVVTDAPPTEPPPAVDARKAKRGVHRKKKSGPMRNFIEWMLIIGAALLVALVIK